MSEKGQVYLPQVMECQLYGGGSINNTKATAGS